MSSRNVYLSPEDRKKAPLIHQTLQETAADISSGAIPQDAADKAALTLERAGFAVDYVAARNAENLQPVVSCEERIRLLAAATLGKTRLIDNIPAGR